MISNYSVLIAFRHVLIIDWVHVFKNHGGARTVWLALKHSLRDWIEDAQAIIELDSPVFNVADLDVLDVDACFVVHLPNHIDEAVIKSCIVCENYIQ